MPIGLVGRKAGMTRVFTGEGASIPVTVVVAEPNRVTCLKTPGDRRLPRGAGDHGHEEAQSRIATAGRAHGPGRRRGR